MKSKSLLWLLITVLLITAPSAHARQPTNDLEVMIRILGALLAVVLLQFITGENDSRIPGPAHSCAE